ncbi:hypothetical protein WFJ45_24495, partial [Salmonella enterica subsp. enterica serovar Minnesota]|uniref:hypothetical protein n=1 Tax=Salmonella enterica TaxID=28901 RepID=UPI003D2D08F8
RVRIDPPGRGRLTVHVRDKRERLVSSATLRFTRDARRTLTLKPRRATRAATVTVKWRPVRGTPQTVRR